MIDTTTAASRNEDRAMTEMIERVARAILAANGGEGECAWDLDWRDYVDDARAAIEEMREPTEAMVEVLYDPTVNTRSAVAADWRDMIDAALGEKP